LACWILGVRLMDTRGMLLAVVGHIQPVLEQLDAGIQNTLLKFIARM
jgi:hypothetical protein